MKISNWPQLTLLLCSWAANLVLLAIVGLIMGANFISEDVTRGALLLKPVTHYLLPSYPFVTGALIVAAYVFRTHLTALQKWTCVTHSLACLAFVLWSR